MNYKQLFYFWNVATLGGVYRAAERLNLTPQTISGQISELQKSLEVDLFRRVGRKLELTQAGQLTLAQAEKIFQLGEELEMSLRNFPIENELLFEVGVMDAVPKSMAYRLLQPAFEIDRPMRLICHEDKPDNLFAELAIRRLDLLIADRPLPRELGIRGFNHELGTSSVTFCACESLARQYASGFPESLDGAHLLLPRKGATLRGAVTNWLAKAGIHPRIVGEFDDTVLMKAFGQAGLGVFPVPTVIAEEVMNAFAVRSLGCANDATVKYFAIAREREPKHPAVVAVNHKAPNTFAPAKCD
ncbi:Na(+)/H(+) antiporter regulatory protein [Thiorhodovibrio winogradskyi]|uniref:Na(+)/H(+) antiporter regulatory protein n=1 Tax=Thiorhodovibrio winogradskyi TaxID=77007 RepID=A0ABZ0SBH9_9GAMM|nr:LysR family transcriptional regulator [Thiorhodovibrio winogradskyi]